jgi:hypothetical protein
MMFATQFACTERHWLYGIACKQSVRSLYVSHRTVCDQLQMTPVASPAQGCRFESILCCSCELKLCFRLQCTLAYLVGMPALTNQRVFRRHLLRSDDIRRRRSRNSSAAMNESNPLSRLGTSAGQCSARSAKCVSSQSATEYTS